MKTGLCLSGGGAKGAFQVGVFEYLLEHPELFPNGFNDGSHTSVGAISGSGLACFKPGPEQIRQYTEFLVECWSSITQTSDIWDLRWPPYLAGLWNPSVGRNTPLKGLLKKLLQSRFKDMASGTRTEVAAWDLLSGQPVYFLLNECKTLDEVVSRIAASGSYPLALPPEEIQQYFCTDGGIVAIAPADRLIKAGCDHILAVVCRSPDHLDAMKKEDLQSVPAVGARCLDGMESAIVQANLEQIRLWNLLVDAGHPKAQGKRHIKLDVITPVAPLGNPLDFSPPLSVRRRKVGYDSAKMYFESRG
jgi:NTE family protein